jgi:CRISPR-associated endonuclease Csn1
MSFCPSYVSSLIKSYDAKSKIGEFGSLNKMEISIDNVRVKEKCWLLKVDRLGGIRHNS